MERVNQNRFRWTYDYCGRKSIKVSTELHYPYNHSHSSALSTNANMLLLLWSLAICFIFNICLQMTKIFVNRDTACSKMHAATAAPKAIRPCSSSFFHDICTGITCEFFQYQQRHSAFFSLKAFFELSFALFNEKIKPSGVYVLC